VFSFYETFEYKYQNMHTKVTKVSKHRGVICSLDYTVFLLNKMLRVTVVYDSLLCLLYVVLRVTVVYDSLLCLLYVFYVLP